MDVVEVMNEENFFRLLKIDRPEYNVVRFKGKKGFLGTYTGIWLYWFFISSPDFESMKIVFESATPPIEMQPKLQKLELVLAKSISE